MEEKIEPPVKFRWKIIVEIFLVAFVLYILVAILTPPRHGSRENARRASCQSNLKGIMVGLKLYLQDYDEGYPLATTAKPAFGWAGAIQLHTQPEENFQCPSEKHAPGAAPSQSGYTDYWFNSRLYGLKTSEVWDEKQTITLGEGDSGDARYHLSQIPQRWRNDLKSPLYRHLEAANYAFADGHVKWFRFSRWKTELDMDGGPTFRLKPRN